MINFLASIFVLIALSVSGNLLANSTNILSFEEATELALNHSPLLRMEAADIQEKLGVEMQVGAFPNPILAVKADNIGNREIKKWQDVEINYELAQLIELTNKRYYRMQTAAYQVQAAHAGYQAVQLAVMNRLYKSYVRYAAAQELLNVAMDQKQVAAASLEVTKQHVANGKASLIQQNRAEIAYMQADIAYEKALALLGIAKDSLAYFWEGVCFDFVQVNYQLVGQVLPDDLETCIENLENHPELLKAHYVALAAKETVQLEKANAVPDLIVSVGYHETPDANTRGAILGAAIQLPIFDQNRGNIWRARALREKSADQYEEIYLRLKNKLSVAVRELMVAHEEVKRLESLLSTSVVQAFNFAKEGYAEGKLDYADLLDAQRALFEMRQILIQAALNYSLKLADVEYLTSIDS